MPYFQCRLTTENGDVIAQSFLAPSRDECRRRFEGQGFCILSIKRDWKRIQIPLLPFEKKIKDKDFTMFNQELVALIKAGYPILKSIETIATRVKNIHLKEVLMKIEHEVKGGRSLSEAFSKVKEGFSTVYIASLMAGERSGNLAETIGRYIEYEKVISQTKSRIKTALMYPTLLLVVSAILLGILINFVIPRFSAFYIDFEAQLPVITKVLMSFSLAAKKYFYFVFAFIFLLIFLYIQMKSRAKTLTWLDKIKLKIPYAKTIWIESTISLFSRTLSLLLEGGISLLSSIGIAQHAVTNKYLQGKMKNLPDFIKNGESLSYSLEKADYFPPLALDMIRIGESSANLEGMLSDVSEVFEDRIRAKIDTFVSLIEPVIIVIMGLVVAFMLLSVYLPIFNIISVTR